MLHNSANLNAVLKLVHVHKQGFDFATNINSTPSSSTPSAWYPAPAPAAPTPGALAVPLIVNGPSGRMSFLSTTLLFGSPLDVTLSELAIEIFLPADEETVTRLRAASAATAASQNPRR